MRKNQLGVSLGGLMVGAVILIVFAMVGIKLAPSYVEFFAIKKAINAIAQEKSGASVKEIRNSFELRASVDDIRSIKGPDLEITKDGNDLLISASYRKEIQLVGNIGVYIDFHAASK